MNPILEKQFAHLRMRLAKSPLPRFFVWWWGELLACLPARWRSALGDRSETLLLDLRPSEIVVWRERGEAVNEYARISRTLPPEEQGIEFLRLRLALGDPLVRTVFCIPSGRVLTRKLSLPSAAEENLRQVLSFEMDRQTPFKADQIYFDSHVLGRDANGRNAQVELVLIPRGQFNQELAALPAAAAMQLDGVDSWRAAAGASRRHINLLPSEYRARRRNIRLPVNLGLCALALVLIVMNMDASLVNRAAAVDAMRAAVEASTTDAKQVTALRKTLADSISGANFLAERKRKGLLIVALLNDLTRQLPEDTYLERMQLINKQVVLQGQSKEATKLIALLAASPCLGNPGFQGQIQPDPRSGRDRFQINADLKDCNPATIAPAAPAAGAANPPPADAANPPPPPAGSNASAQPATGATHGG
ncbi:MAG: PilN domain-containing protein [Rhodanobacter sp.]|nr:PilN domain-containing protein [Rhodanobacter sp.]